ncbi:MAG: hypothetical protein WDM92_00205 [Caulobacteraceae bacterium]
MIFGMTTYTFVHVLISLADILSGFVVLYGLLTGERMPAWAAVFLATALATDLTGFGFPFHGVDPAIVVGSSRPSCSWRRSRPSTSSTSPGRGAASM